MKIAIYIPSISQLDIEGSRLVLLKNHKELEEEKNIRIRNSLDMLRPLSISRLSKKLEL